MHFSFIWFKNIKKTLKEIRRVTARGGYIAFCAEPDYEMTIESPEREGILKDDLINFIRKMEGNSRAGRDILKFNDFKDIKMLKF